MMNRSKALTCAVLTALVATSAVTREAKAVVVTITDTLSGLDEGLVVFNSNGYETETVGSTFPSQSSPDGSSYSTPLFGSPTNNTSNSTTVTGAASGGPTSAYTGDNYLAVTRTNSTYGIGSDFSRSINLANESFKFEYAFWGTTNATAFGIGSNVGNVTVSTPGVLAGWRYFANANDLTQYPNSVQDDPAGSPGALPDELAALTYNVGGWNVLSYEWDYTTQLGTYTLNGDSAAALPREVGASTSQAAPLTVNRFFTSPGAGSTTIWMESTTAAVPEPASFGLIAAAGSLLLARRRRAN